MSRRRLRRRLRRLRRRLRPPGLRNRRLRHLCACVGPARLRRLRAIAAVPGTGTESEECDIIEL